MKKSKLVMIGNGMAGVRTLEELLKIAPELYDITVFGAEPHPNYNRILLSPVLAGEQTVDEIILNSWDWYTDNHITLHAGWKVTEVDRVKRVVQTVFLIILFLGFFCKIGTREGERIFRAMRGLIRMLPLRGVHVVGNVNRIHPSNGFRLLALYTFFQGFLL